MDIAKACFNSPKLLDGILSCIQQAIIITDIEGHIFFASTIAEKLLGYTPDELKGEKLSLIFTQEDLTYLYPNLLFMARKNRSFEGDLMIVRRNKTSFLGFIVFRTYFDPEQGNSLIFVCIQDINKEKQQKRVLRGSHDDDLIKVADGIAHELRNPLVGIGGFAKRLYDSCKSSAEHDKYYGYIINNIEKIEGLVKKVEFFATLPKPSITEEPVRELVEKALKPYLQQIENRKIALSITMEEVNLLVDEALFVKVISILIENALDALSDGERILIHSMTKDNQHEIHVTDTGAGISPGDIPYVFDPFFSTKPNGAGIDLAIVRRIMSNHGGQVEVTSKQGKGTTFVLLFPIERRRSIRVSSLED